MIRHLTPHLISPQHVNEPGSSFLINPCDLRAYLGVAMDSSSLHALLLLSDSTLPLGSFAFSSGLESYLAHHHKTSTSSRGRESRFFTFLRHSLANLASTALPFVKSTHEAAHRLPDLDNDCDASTACTVARRASTTQGRALVVVWERALRAACPSESPLAVEAVAAIDASAAQLRSSSQEVFFFKGHFAPLFGAVCAALSVGEHETAYLFLLNHAKALLSAAVRAGVLGPYQSQAILAGGNLQTCLRECLSQEKPRKAENVAVTAPIMDLWIGRHELLYSRIFNS